MKSPKTMLSVATMCAAVATGCYHDRVVREPAGATTTRTTVRETVSTAEPVTYETRVVAPRAETRTVTTTVPAPPVSETVIVEAPPAPHLETQGIAPTSSHAWVPGHWTRDADRWVWSSGRWEMKPAATSVYVPGHWQQRGTGFVWQEGYWK